HDNGTLSLPTAFGKTVIGAALIDERKCNTLILVHLQTLLAQWKRSLEQFLVIETIPQEKKRKPRSAIGQIGQGHNTATGIVDIALFQSLIHDGEVDETVHNYGMVIVDECHHVPSLNYEKVLAACNARFVYGLTATPVRADGLHPLIFMQCGAVRYAVDAKSQAAKRQFEHCLIPCFTAFKKPLTQDADDWHITQIYTALTEDEFRNQQIVTDAVEALNEGRTPIVLAQRKEHVARLTEMLKTQTNATVISLVGTASAKAKQTAMATLTNIADNERFAIVATGKYVGEGFDCPRLDTLLLASPIAWKGTLAQYVGRLHRDFQGKTDVRVYDYVDIHVPVLERMYHKRLNGYAQIGYKVSAAKNEPDRMSLIYDSKSFLPVLKNDLLQSQREILIVSPYMRKRRVETVLEWLKTPVNKGIAVTVITRPPEAYKDNQTISDCITLLQPAVKVVLKPRIHQKFVIIDNRLVWYGSVNLLSFGSSEETMMRLDSRELSAELELQG
ncbi:MAG: DEAD/DEAH box helicase family protein, partial [Acidobacteriota bacterium]|nr:DEAD/DEAH box helicase family protein [Acidobacteriota bacterium]